MKPSEHELNTNLLFLFVCIQTYSNAYINIPIDSHTWNYTQHLPCCFSPSGTASLLVKNPSQEVLT